MAKKTVISDELALNELNDFVQKWQKKPLPKDELKEYYPDLLESIMTGNLIIGENKVPVYKLTAPIKNDEGQDSYTEINFKTRVKPTTKADLADGLNLQKQQAKFTLRIIAHIIGQPVVFLDKLDEVDYDVVSTLATFFM